MAFVINKPATFSFTVVSKSISNHSIICFYITRFFKLFGAGKLFLLLFLFNLTYSKGANNLT